MVSDSRFGRTTAALLRWSMRARALLVVAGLGACTANAAQTIGGSLALTSDYLVRGISRSNHELALQADVNFVTDGGYFAGLFASNVQFDSGDRRSAELSAFAGFAWQATDAWRAKITSSYYGYIWNDSGSQYNYAELGIDAAYDDWLDFSIVYSPDAPRYVSDRGLTGVTAKSADVNVHTPWRHHLAASAGVGYSTYGGPGGGGYSYWSAGGVLDLAPASLSISYVSTSAGADDLFYNAAAHSRWTATLIWRF